MTSHGSIRGNLCSSESLGQVLEKEIPAGAFRLHEFGERTPFDRSQQGLVRNFERWFWGRRCRFRNRFRGRFLGPLLHEICQGNGVRPLDKGDEGLGKLFSVTALRELEKPRDHSEGFLVEKPHKLFGASESA